VQGFEPSKGHAFSTYAVPVLVRDTMRKRVFPGLLRELVIAV